VTSLEPRLKTYDGTGILIIRVVDPDISVKPTNIGDGPLNYIVYQTKSYFVYIKESSLFLSNGFCGVLGCTKKQDQQQRKCQSEYLEI
jgi:hypothetical protein